MEIHNILSDAIRKLRWRADKKTISYACLPCQEQKATHSQTFYTRI